VHQQLFEPPKKGKIERGKLFRSNIGEHLQYVRFRNIQRVDDIVVYHFLGEKGGEKEVVGSNSKGLSSPSDMV
jgi:hypothetical protein